MNKKLFMTFAMAGLLLTACNSSKSKSDSSEKEKTEKKAEIAAEDEQEEVQEREYDESLPRFENFVQYDAEENEIDMATFISENELTIVDFWASWCGPCVAEIPNLQSIYEDYQSQGLEIISISLDEDFNTWQNAIQEHGMTWYQVTDMKGWQNAGVKTYGIQSIPRIMVVDKMGGIISDDTRGEELRQIVEDYFQ